MKNVVTIKKRWISILLAVCMLFSMVPLSTTIANASEPAYTINNVYPWGSAMNTDIITFHAPGTGFVSYQWQTAASKNGSYTNIGTGETLIFTPTDGNWYRCVMTPASGSPVTSEAVQLVKSQSTIINDWYDVEYTINGYKALQLNYPYYWYITNGKMAYTVLSYGNDYTNIDIIGQYTKNGIPYWMNTSYYSGWQLYSSTAAAPASSDNNNAKLDALRLSFDESNPAAIKVEADLSSDQQAFAFGTDVMLGDSTITRDSYNPDRAALTFCEEDNEQWVRMVGAEKADTEPYFQDNDPAFVLKYTDHPSCFWLGHWKSRVIYSYNISTTGSNVKEIKTINGTENVVTEYANDDSGMTSSWMNLTAGSTVHFGFSIGTVVETGALGVSGRVDYENEKLTELEPGRDYTIDFNEDGMTDITVTGDTYGKAPLVGKNKNNISYDLVGKRITITPVATGGEQVTSQSIEITARPNKPGSPTAPDNASIADKPSSVPGSAPENEITISGTTITIDAAHGQEYSNDGGVTWIKPDGSGKVVFINQPINEDISIITRIYATDNAPKSEGSDPATVRILSTMDVICSGYDGTYDGSNHSISVDAVSVEGENIAYSENYDGLYTASKPTYRNVGSYTVYYRITKEGYYPYYGSANVEISQATPVLNNVSGQPITYGEKLSDSLLDGSATLNNEEVRGTLEWLNGDITYPAVADSGTTHYTVVFTPEDILNYKSVQKDITIAVNRASQDQPITPGTVNETVSRKADGKITGVTDNMEYCLEGGSYISVPSGATVITGLSAGKYYVRYMSDANHNASPGVPVIIQPGRKLIVTIPDNQEGYTLTASKSSADWNEQVTLTLNIAEGYDQISTQPVKANGNPLAFENETYVITMQQDVDITVTGIEDITAPEGTITVGTSWWKELLNTITFRLFFNNSVDVTITSTDKGSGIDTIEYYRSECALTRSQVEALTSWSRYTEKITEDARDAAKYVYYVKLTDKAGNIKYISSDGFIFDLVLPVIVGVEKDATYYTTQKFTVNEDNLKDIEIKQGMVREYFDTPQTDYTIEGNVDRIYSITVTDIAGNEAFYSIIMKPLSDIYDDIDGITDDNVKSSDKDAVEAVKGALSAIDSTNATDAEKREIADKLADCEGLLKKISDVGAEIARVSETLPENATKEETENRLIDIYKLIRGFNLTDKERSDIESKKDEVKRQIEKLEGGVVVETKDQVVMITEDSLNKETNDDVKKAVDNAKDEGKDISYHVVVEVIELKELDVDEIKADADKVDKLAENDGKTVAMYLDLSVTVKADGVTIGKLTELDDEIEFKVKVPEELLNVGNLKFFIIRVHNGIAEEINCEVKDGYAYFKTNKFSTYALAYKEVIEKPAKTGDNTNPIFWLFTMVLAILVISGSVSCKRRRHN